MTSSLPFTGMRKAAALVALLAACGTPEPERTPYQVEVDRLAGDLICPALCRELNDLRQGEVPAGWSDDQRQMLVRVASVRYEKDCARG